MISRTAEERKVDVNLSDRVGARRRNCQTRMDQLSLCSRGERLSLIKENELIDFSSCNVVRPLILDNERHQA